MSPPVMRKSFRDPAHACEQNCCAKFQNSTSPKIGFKTTTQSASMQHKAASKSCLVDEVVAPDTAAAFALVHGLSTMVLGEHRSVTAHRAPAFEATIVATSRVSVEFFRGGNSRSRNRRRRRFWLWRRLVFRAPDAIATALAAFLRHSAPTRGVGLALAGIAAIGFVRAPPAEDRIVLHLAQRAKTLPAAISSVARGRSRGWSRNRLGWAWRWRLFDGTLSRSPLSRSYGNIRASARKRFRININSSGCN